MINKAEALQALDALIDYFDQQQVDRKVKINPAPTQQSDSGDACSCGVCTDGFDLFGLIAAQEAESAAVQKAVDEYNDASEPEDEDLEDYEAWDATDEAFRTYVFDSISGDPAEVTIDEPQIVCKYTKTGEQHVSDKDGTLHVVPPGWLVIEIVPKDASALTYK